MLSGLCWPVRPDFLPGEILTSWMVRIAHAHRLSAQIFYDRTIGHDHPIWSRDIDRQPPLWLLQLLAQRTGKRLAEIQTLALTDYEGSVFERQRSFGLQEWILPLLKYHRIHRGFGMQFCPLCLKEDAIPYFRKVWRLALYTFCPAHGVILHDRCPQCGNGVSFHRQRDGDWPLRGFVALSFCTHCGFDLATAPVRPVTIWSADILRNRQYVLSKLAGCQNENDRWNSSMFVILHHLCALLAWKDGDRLLEYVIKQSGMPAATLSREGRTIEHRPPAERYFLLDAACWLLGDYPHRLRNVWTSGTMPCSQLLRNKHKLPWWFIKDVMG